MMAEFGDIWYEALAVEIDSGGDGCDLIDIEIVSATKALANKLVVSQCFSSFGQRISVNYVTQIHTIVSSW